MDLANTRMYINPFCEIAMQEAANLKAKGSIKEITALSIGPKGYPIIYAKREENSVDPSRYWSRQGHIYKYRPSARLSSTASASGSSPKAYSSQRQD